jgi:AraC-like DNA-binding protein
MPLRSLSFDQYSDMVVDAAVNFLLTGPSIGSWSVGHCAFGPIILQFGTEGGSKVLHGISRSDALSFVLQDTQIADRMIFDGETIQPQDFVVLPPGSNFTFASQGSHRWMSATMPVEFFAAHVARTGRSEVVDIVTQKRIVSPPQRLLELFLSSAASAAAFAREVRTPLLDGRAAGVASDLLTALIDAIGGTGRAIAVPTQHSRSTNNTVTRALEYVRGQKWGGLQVTDMADAAEVTSRTLLRVFRQQLDLGPASYLKLRQLNIVRRELRGKHAPVRKITDIMGEQGVTEFGRFASEYRALFRERPSDTLARSRLELERDGFQVERPRRSLRG